MLRRRFESIRVSSNIVQAIDRLFGKNHSFKYDDVDTAMRNFLRDYDLSQYNISGDIDDKMDSLSDFVISGGLEEDDLYGLRDYIEGFLKTRDVIDSILYYYNRKNSDYRAGVFSAMRGICSTLEKEHK